MYPSNEDFIHKFCAQADVMQTTRVKYTAHLGEFARWLSHTNSPSHVALLTQARRAEIVHFLAFLLEGDRYAATAHAQRTRSMSASTRASVIGTLNALYTYLVSVGLAAGNPVDDVPRPKKRYRPGITLTADEIRRLIEVRTNPRDRIQTYLLAYTAARAGELRELTWSDIDFTAATIALRGKDLSIRMVDIHPMLMAELRR